MINMKQDYYSCYRFYDDKGRRIASFCKEVPGGLKVFLLYRYVNKKHQFNKRKATEAYTEWRYKELFPYFDYETLLIPIPDQSTAKYTFMQYLENRFYKKKTYKMVIPGQRITVARIYNKGLPLSELMYIESEEFYKENNTNGKRQPDTTEKNHTTV
jgi:hypothetical protein